MVNEKEKFAKANFLQKSQTSHKENLQRKNQFLNFAKFSKELLVIIPHSGTKIPSEIIISSISKKGFEMVGSPNAETDWFSDKLYDFRKILHNKQLVFPYSQVFLNVCRSPENINSAVPVSIRGNPVFEKNSIPTLEERKNLLKKYYLPFYEKIKSFKGKLIFNGHTTVSGHSSLNSGLNYDIALSSFFIQNGKKIIFAPEKVLMIYAKELKKRFPSLRIGINDLYMDVYEYICGLVGKEKALQESQ